VDCIPCEYNGSVFAYDCINQTLSCGLEEINPNKILSNTLNTLLETQGYNKNQCDLNSIVSTWYIDCRLDNDILIQESFYTGYGFYDSPTQTTVINEINNKLVGLYNYGLNYYLAGNTLIVSNSTCYDNFTNKNLYLNIGINIQINCDNAINNNILA
jgi:hypothetical protein